MFRKKNLLRRLALFLAINTVLQIVFPAVSYALTSGPTAPEYSSFEPVDTSDMVNLATGDFTYNIPLLEVPGPAGGYPLSLNYHAGISPGMEASWVGLGWNLNPGAINRSVNGYADDHNLAANNRTDFWEGGERVTYTAGFSVGLAHTPASVGFGLQIANDTYQGMGVGMYAEAGASKSYNAGPLGVKLSANMRVGVAPYGGTYAGGGISSDIGLSTSIGMVLGQSNSFGYNSGTGSYATTTLSAQHSALGASVSSNEKGEISSSTSVAGVSSNVENGSFGRISNEAFSIGGAFPIGKGFNLHLSYSKLRYWMLESKSVDASGVLHMENSNGANRAFDTYSLMSKEESLLEEPVAEKAATGTFADYDHYSVSAQGLAGNIRPYAFEVQLKNQSRSHYEGENYVQELSSIPVYQYNSNKSPNEPAWQFRFVGDYSNMHHVSQTPSIETFQVEVRDDRTGHTDYKELLGYKPAVFQSNLKEEGYIPGSKHIEFFTNGQIINNPSEARARGFVETGASGYVRGATKDINFTPNSITDDISIASNIGAYTITNSSGVSYHYSLPVYSYDEVIISENLQMAQDENGRSFTKIKKTAPYAYAWLLTGITGADYVDRNNNGKVDQGDWGYWVEFDYGLWHEAFRWRNPGVGYHIDEDKNFRNYSSGYKEIYYLDAVRTATHTAYFVKEMRDDAKSAVYVLKDEFASGESERPLTKWKGTYNANSAIENCNGSSFVYRSRPVSQLALKKIVLTKNNLDYSGLKSHSNIYDYNFSIGAATTCQTKVLNIPLYNKTNSQTADNVVDVGDLAGFPNLESSAFQVIEMGYDKANPLMPKTPNSYNSSYIYKSSPETIRQEHLVGKLTLKKVDFKGRGSSGGGIIPPIAFDYGTYNPEYSSDKLDIWGMYKSDFSGTSGTNDVTKRLVSEASAENLEAWSLKKIYTSVGATLHIDYEPDRYSNTVLQNNWVGQVSNLVSEPDNNRILIEFFNLSAQDLQDVKVGDKLEILVGYDLRKACEDPRSPRESFTNKFYKGEHRVVGKLSNKVYISRDELGDILDYFEKISTYCTQNNVSVVANVKFDNLHQKGGGIRVASVMVTDPLTNSFSRTNYDYTHPLTGLSSGVTSYEPTGLESYQKMAFRSPSTLFKTELYRVYNMLLQGARIIPSPGVLYEYVTVSEQTGKLDAYDQLVGINNLPGKTRYHFQVFRQEMVDWSFEKGEVQEYKPRAFSTNTNLLIPAVAKIRDWSNKVGSLLSITNLDAKNYRLSETKFRFSDEDLPADREGRFNNWYSLFNGQGIIEEVQYNARKMHYKENAVESDTVIAIISQRSEFPVVQTGVTTTNYRTGIQNTTRSLSFDKWSGEVVKNYSEDGYGNRYVSEAVPAYQYYPDMGHKINGPGFKHMLTQMAETKLVKVNNSLQPVGVVSASVQTWSNNIEVVENEGPQTSIWRKHQNYNWEGRTVNETDGTGVVGDFVPFNFASSLQDEQWVKWSEIRLYNKWSKGLEASDMYNRFASVRMDSKGSKVVASVANSKWEKVALFSEEAITGVPCPTTNLNNEQGVLSTSRAHTGKHSLKVGAGEYAFSTSFSLGDGPDSYLLSFWVHKDGLDRLELELQNSDGVTFKQLSSIDATKAGNFYLFTLPVSPQVKLKNIGASAVYLDDIRVHPIDASVTSYVYNNFDELEYLLDGHNFFSRYEYDKMGRLKGTYLETVQFGEKQLSKFSSNYGKENRDALAVTLTKSGTYNPTIIAYGPDRNKEYLFTWFYKESGAANWTKYGFERGRSATYPVPEMCTHEVKCEIEDEKGRKGVAFTTAESSEFVIANTYQDYPEMFRYSVELAGGVSPYKYVWKYRKTPDGRLLDLMYATGSYYQFNIRNSAILCNGYEVVLNVYDQCERKTYVFPPVKLPALQISSPTVDEATNTYSITASGGSNYYTYNWIKNGLQVASGSSNTYSFGAGNVTCSDVIKCLVVDYCGESKSYTYQSSTSGPLSVSTNSLLSSDKTSARLFADATGGCEPYSYKWYDQFNNFLGTGSDLMVNLACGDNSFTCKVTDSKNTVVSDSEFFYRTCDRQLEPALQY